MTTAIRRILNLSLGWLLAVMMAVAALNVLLQVFTRYVLNNPVSFTEEVARYLLVWISLLGAAYAAGNKAHLAIDLLSTKLTGTPGRILDTVVNALIIVFALLALVIGGWMYVGDMLSRGQTSPALGIRVGFLYTSVPICGLLITIYVLLNTIDVWFPPSREKVNSDAEVDLA